MFTNFLNLWLLGRVIQAATAGLLCILGALLGLRIVVRWKWGQSSEQQLALERKAELVASAIQVALVFEVLGLGLSLLVADHLVGSIRGAMCAFGVLASTRTGFYGLLTTVLTTAACAQWIVLHHLDLLSEKPLLTRRKFLWLLAVAPLALGDMTLVIAFAYELDFKVIASCCSVWVDDAIVNNQAAKFVLSPGWSAGLGLAAILTALVNTVLVWREPRKAFVLAAGACSALAPVLALPALLGVVAPHALETPAHFCPFCLFHAQGSYLGWPLFTALFLGSVAGVGLGVVELNRGATDAPALVRTMQKSLAGWSAVAWSGVLICGLFPVIRYWINSGGVFVFGEL